MKWFRYHRIFAGLVVGGIAVLSIGAIDNTKAPPTENIYIVQKGDNLWRIASQYCSDEDNIQEFIYEHQKNIYEIKKDNPHIENYLQVGQKIVIKKELVDTGISTNSQEHKY